MTQLTVQGVTPATVSHPAEQIRKFLSEDSAAWQPCSPEFLNYALALLVFAIRYPSVFWKTNKESSQNIG